MGRFNIAQRVQRFGLKETLLQFGYLVNYFVRKYLFRQRWLTRRIHNYRLHLDLWYPGLSRSIAISGTREDQLKYLLERELQHGNTVLDLGANIGYYTIMMARLIGSSGKIYAMEPEPRNFSLLKDNICLNGVEDQVEALNIAAGAQRGKAKFYISEYSNLHTFLPYTREGKTIEGITGNSIDVKVTDLSSFLVGKRSVDLLRMDIEGYEVEVLNGLKSAIVDGLFQGKIVFETHFPKYDDKQHSMRKPLQWLFEHGYHVSSVTSSDEQKSRLKERGYQPFHLIKTSNTRFRGIYGSISENDAIYFICEVGGIRDVVLTRV